jgi:hypothetical protein
MPPRYRAHVDATTFAANSVKGKGGRATVILYYDAPRPFALRRDLIHSRRRVEAPHAEEYVGVNRFSTDGHDL